MKVARGAKGRGRQRRTGSGTDIGSSQDAGGHASVLPGNVSVSVRYRRTLPMEVSTPSRWFAEGAGAFDVVSARALAPLDRLLGWAAPLFGPGTTGLFLKGKGVEDELTLARKSWIFDVDLHPSQSDPAGSVLVLRGLHGRDRKDARD